MSTATGVDFYRKIVCLARRNYLDVNALMTAPETRVLCVMEKGRLIQHILTRDAATFFLKKQMVRI